jgi:manganese/zinc/iron transport system permease protein
VDSFNWGLVFIFCTLWVSGLCLSALGNILHWRKSPLLADALSHSVLPGLVVGYLVLGTKNTFVMVLGGLLSAGLAAFLMHCLESQYKFRKDVSIVVTYTSFFSLGVFLLSYFAKDIDLDPDCVLFGEIAFLPLKESLYMGGIPLGPNAMWTIFFVATVTVFFLVLFRRFWIWDSFDANHMSVSGGFPGELFHFVFLFYFAFVLVMHFEMMGSIAVLVNLLIPPAFAHMFSRSMRGFWTLSLGWVTLSTILGFVFSLKTNTQYSAGVGVVSFTSFCGVIAFLWIRRRKELGPL